ncbi:potassium channel family protein [Kribbella solani]|uniref:Trk system potassium uptake protein TrkA n=1 Tax=Kribbella solani TaxID=236067 RepID=A0A841DIV8_9ACTN|nr:TrkA family potassium uptake protein [Kribbella solani]MBB5978503.1 trk system potassium uptake protein TrkA [Kribbella solani]
MKVLIAGGGRLGDQAAQLLTATSHQVTVIDQRRARLEELGDAPYRLVHGDACEPKILETAGALNADLLLAATGEDEDNLVIALLAKRQFGVGRTLARINDPGNAWLFDERWGVDVALPAEASLISLIEEATGATDTVGLIRLAAAGVSVIETHLDEDSAAVRTTPGGLSLPGGTVVGAVVRDGKPVVPGNDYRFAPGDTVLVVTTTATAADIRAAFQRPTQ